MFWLGVSVGAVAGAFVAWALAGFFTVRLIRTLRYLPTPMELPPPPKGRNYGPIRSDLGRRYTSGTRAFLSSLSGLTSTVHKSILGG